MCVFFSGCIVWWPQGNCPRCRHNVEGFLYLLALCEGNPWVIKGSPHVGPVRITQRMASFLSPNCAPNANNNGYCPISHSICINRTCVHDQHIPNAYRNFSNYVKVALVCDVNLYICSNTLPMELIHVHVIMCGFNTHFITIIKP